MWGGGGGRIPSAGAQWGWGEVRHTAAPRELESKADMAWDVGARTGPRLRGRGRGRAALAFRPARRGVWLWRGGGGAAGNGARDSVGYGYVLCGAAGTTLQTLTAQMHALEDDEEE